MTEKLAMMAARAREAFKSEQAKMPREDVPVASFARRAIETPAGETPLLVYHPLPLPPAPLPVFVNFHGGGFVMGSADDDDVWCRKIANAAACVVVSVDYRLAPEHKFPTALEECYSVVKWIYEHPLALGIDPRRIAVGGHSAGGNLAAALCLMAKEKGEFPIVLQILNYPPLNLSIDPFTRPDTDTLLTPRAQAFFNSCYFRTAADALEPLVSPLFAADLAGLPHALIITAEHDPLRSDGEQYAERLAAAGGGVTYKMFTGCMHAFTHYGPPEKAQAAWSLIYSELTRVFAAAGE